MKKNIKIIGFAVLLSVLTCRNAGAETIYLSVAASMTDAFKEIIAEFSALHPEARLLPNFASSGALAKQIDQGAPADLYVSANPKWMQFLLEREMIAAGTDRIFAYNKLVFIGQASHAIAQLSDLAALQRIAIGSPQSVPAGQYAKQAMDGARIYAVLEQEKKLVIAKDVRQALLYADRGEVDGAFVYKTDALLAVNARILFTVPDELYDRVSYPLGLTPSGAKKETARSLYSFIESQKAVAVLKKFGFEPAL